MNRNVRETQDWNDHLTRMWSVPDLTPVQVGDKVFTLSLLKICPVCQSRFYAYQREGHEMAPGYTDQNPKHGQGDRETCGHPQCWGVEQETQFNRRLTNGDIPALLVKKNIGATA